MIKSKFETLSVPAEEKKYPYLGLFTLDKDFVVLFIKKETGFVVSSETEDRPIGFYSYRWNEEEFTELKNAKITLEV